MYIPIHDAVRADKPHDEPTGGWSSLIGIVTAICGNILISFALNTQRYAHMRLGQDRDDANEKSRAERERQRGQNSGYEDQRRAADERSRKNAEEPSQSVAADDERQPLIPRIGSRKTSSSTSDTYVDEDKEESAKSYLKSPIWWLGISMMVVGEAGNFLAYGFAPASIVSPLGVVALISNCLIAPLLLHEEFRIRDGLGVIIAIAGCVTVVLSASGSNPKLSPDDIWDLITEWEFETYLGVTGGLIVVLMFASNKFGDRTVLIDLGLVGLFGGYTALSTKGVASLLSNTIWRAFTFPITYVLVVILVATAVLQIKYVNRALQRFNSTIVIPTQFVLFTISVIVGSAVLYRDFERQSAADAGKFVGGCALTFLGVWFITSGRSSNDEDEDEDDDGKRDRVNLVDHEAVSAQERPATRRTHSDTMPPSLVVSDSTAALDQTLTAAGPAMRAAVRPDAATMRSRTTDPRKMPTLHATTSEPVITTLDTSAHTLHPQTPSRGHPSPTMDGNRLLGRHSIADLLPGPLMSPLSSSLSAIVADSLRRGVDHTPVSTIRARSFRLTRRRTGEDKTTARRRSIDSADLDADERSEAAETPQSASGRNRSFSATITDIFKRQKSYDASDA
ncbi:hypothetical protein AMS68_004911 [Peltaster fructicola]|uniref:Uncharacterized protein n=1 Tax=Peltaster fructicola TaxID=286661 RepID=A0A6H0XXE0_9PEZI|nr:hypothetical protein AMS68_004911 [Peltaster fructicola]